MLAIAGLFIILVLVLALPFLVKKVEENLELFLFVMGAAAVSVSSLWSWHLVKEALVEPIKITLAVLIAGTLFKFARPALARAIEAASSALGVRFFAAAVVVLLGILSSVITAIISALVLVEIVGCLKLERKVEVRLVVIACFAIGIGAALTPIGEPLSTIAIGKLSGEPYHAGFWFLFRELWFFVIPGILGFGAVAAALVGGKSGACNGLDEDRAEGLKDVLVRTVKTYVFVMALVFLGSGFKPIIDAYVSKIPSLGLYWINSISAILDNATLTAAEIGPTMSTGQIGSAILGLIVAGGILIPGNIPNIISAGKLKIRSGEWAAFGAPVGLAAMVLYFVVMLVVHY